MENNEEKEYIINVLNEINSEDISEHAGNVQHLLQRFLNKKNDLCENLTLPYEKLNITDNSTFWKYLCVNFNLLNELKNIVNNSTPEDVLSVQQTKDLRRIFNNITTIGISPNLLKNLIAFKELKGYDANNEEDVLLRYHRLVATIYNVTECVNCLKLRYALLPQCLSSILCAFYQIIYCPLKKPSLDVKTGFIMTYIIYNNLLEERNYFNLQFKNLTSSIHKTMYVRETMLLIDNKSPLWFKKAISSNLNAILISEGGLECIAWAMFQSSVDYDQNDRTKNWKTLDVIKKLILNFQNNEILFKNNICYQLRNLLKVKGSNGEGVVVFERLFVLCVKELYKSNEILCLNELVPTFYNFFEIFKSDTKFNYEMDVTDNTIQGIRMVYISFVEDDTNNELLPIKLLKNVINVLFFIYANVNGKISISNELKSILIKYLELNDKREVFDSFLFEFGCNVENNIEVLIKSERILIKQTSHQIKLSTNVRANCIKGLVKDNVNLRFSLFFYCLNCLNEGERYFKNSSNKSLLEIEENFVLDESIERKLTIYELLSELSEDKTLQKRINDDPKEIIRYIENVLLKALGNRTHLQNLNGTESYQNFFTMLMILQALVSNSSVSEEFTKLVPVLKEILQESDNVECNCLIDDIISNISIKENLTNSGRVGEGRCKSEVDEAIENVCDPLLPVRGHGLMVLAKLIEKNDEEAMKRKHYILNIFQQNLKNEDSFIYLSAINGLAAMGNVFPDIVLNTLTEEYSDFNENENGTEEIRIKIGEVLVRITKRLGETAPKYKTLLLNTFLNGTKDEDHLIRASSLSNLGEVCRVLGYKLGSIVNEILACVHSAITTDKSIEARRAAVTVIRQLLNGLNVDMIDFLKEELLEIYRTLKNIYYNDSDDVMKLQAQLALEELNENVKKFLFPKLDYFDKNFVTPK